MLGRPPRRLRSSPTPWGRRWPPIDRAIAPSITTLRSSPTPVGPVLGGEPDRADALQVLVAILTDPGGPVLDLRVERGRVLVILVAILTDPAGPVLVEPFRTGIGSEHRLRSSPTPGGRCWVGVMCTPGPEKPLRSSPTPGAGAGVITARLLSTHPGLRSSPTPGGRCWPPAPAQAPYCGTCCDPHRPRGAGAGRRRSRCDPGPLRVAILTDPGGPVLADRVQADPSLDTALRSSPTPGGRCWYRSALPAGPIRRSCDPHRPREGRCWRRSPVARRQLNSCDPHRPRGAGAGAFRIR